MFCKFLYVSFLLIYFMQYTCQVSMCFRLFYFNLGKKYIFASKRALRLCLWMSNLNLRTGKYSQIDPNQEYI